MSESCLVWSGIAWVIAVIMVMVVAMVILMVTAFPDCPGVAIVGGVLLLPSMVAVVTLTVGLPTAPLLSVVVAVAGAAVGLGGVELVLRGVFLKVRGSHVLLGVVIPMEGLLFPQVTDPAQGQQQQQEQGSTYSSTHYGAQVVLWEGFECWGAEEDVALIVHQGGGRSTV